MIIINDPSIKDVNVVAEEQYPTVSTDKLGDNYLLTHNTEQLCKQEGFKAGVEWARHIFCSRYEKLIAFIDLINHAALTKEEHDTLNKIIEYSGFSAEELKRIGLRYFSLELFSSEALEQEQ